MKLIKIFTLLAATSAISVANAEVISSTNAIVFSESTALSQQVIIKSTYENIDHDADPLTDAIGALTIEASDFTVSNTIGSAATTYSVDTSDCEGVHKKNQTCSVVITYKPSTTLDSQLILFSDPNSSAVFPVYVTNYHAESDATQASRRLSPVIEDVKIFDPEGNELTTNELYSAAENQNYTVEWTVLAYESLRAQAYLFDCVQATKVCAAKFDSGSGKIANSLVVAGVTLTPAEVTAAGFDDYTFNGETAIHQKFTGNIRIVPTDFVDETPHSLALRFVHRTATDSSRQVFTPVSTPLSGNLNFAGQGDSGYFDTVGRALVLTGNKALVAE